jgi:hypothetical protein
MRLRADQMERLRRMARQMGYTPSETSALLLEESLRMSEFGHLQFRNSPVGRQAYVLGTGMAVWEVIMVARAIGGDPVQTAALLQVPDVKVQAALNYAAAYPEEIEAALADNAQGYDVLKRALPRLEQIEITDEVAGADEVSIERQDNAR